MSNVDNNQYSRAPVGDTNTADHAFLGGDGSNRTETGTTGRPFLGASYRSAGNFSSRDDAPMTAAAKKTLAYMQQRNAELVREKKAVVEMRKAVEKSELLRKSTSETYNKQTLNFAKQQKKKFALMEELHRQIDDKTKQENDCAKLEQSINDLENFIQMEYDNREIIMMQGNTQEAIDEETAAPLQADSLLYHTSLRARYTHCLEARINAQESDRQQRQQKLAALEAKISHLHDTTKPKLLAEIRAVEEQEQTAQRQTTELIQQTIPQLGAAVRDALSERAKLRATVKEAQAQRDQANVQMTDAEQQYLAVSET